MFCFLRVGWIPALDAGTYDGKEGSPEPKVVEVTLSLSQQTFLKLLSKRAKAYAKYNKLAGKNGAAKAQLDEPKILDDKGHDQNSMQLSSRVQGGGGADNGDEDAAPAAEMPPTAEPSLQPVAEPPLEPAAELPAAAAPESEVPEHKPTSSEDTTHDKDAGSPSSDEEGDSSTSKLEKATQNLAGLDDLIDEEIQKNSNKSSVVYAFVTFDQPEHAETFVRLYTGARNNAYFAGCCQRKELRFGGTKRLAVVRAPEPSNVVWKNHGYKMPNLIVRRALTALFTLAMLVVSAALLYFANKQKQVDSVPADCPVAVCPPGLNISTNLTCATASTVIERRTSSLLVADHDGITPACVSADGFCLSLEFPQVRFDLPSMRCSLAYLRSGLNVQMVDEDTLCAAAITEYYKNFAIGFIPVVAVLIVNTLLKVVLKALVKMEKHPTESAELAATAFKLFCAQFLNTSIIVFAVSSSAINEAVTVEGVPAAAGDSSSTNEFDIKWYADVGTGICLTLLLNAFVPKIVVCIKEVVGCIKRCSCCAKKKKSQLELDKAFAPSEFDIATRYAQVLNTVFSVLFFSSGMPILLLVGFIDLSMGFAADKFMFTHYYKKPPQYDEAIALMTSKCLPFAVIIHLFMACWTFSARTFVQVGTSVVALSFRHKL